VTASSTPLEPRRWPRGWFLLAGVVCLGLSLWAVQSASRQVVQATSHLPPGRCGAVWVAWIHGCQGLVLLELAGSQASAQTIVKAIEDAGVTDPAVTAVELDYLLIICYMAFLVFLAATVAGVRGLWDVTWVRRALYLVAALQGVAGVLDGIENVGLFAMLKAASVPPGVAEWTCRVSAVKWWLIAAGIVVPVLALAARPLLARGKVWRPGGA
jgi:hypothetical protein